MKYPALSPKHNLKSRYNEIEDLASYAHTLSDEDKAWLNSFAEEYICSNFKHSGTKLHDETDPKVRSAIYGRNNQRNRCIMTIEQSQNKLLYLEDQDIDRIIQAALDDDYE